MGHSQKFEYTEKGNKPNKEKKRDLRAGAKGLLVSYGGYMPGGGGITGSAYSEPTTQIQA